MAYWILIFCMTAGLVLGYFLARRGQVWACSLLSMGGIAAILALRAMALGEPGLHGLGYSIAAFLFLTPLVMGMTVGAVAGWGRWRFVQSRIAKSGAR